MAKCRFVQPDIVRLPLSEGDWIEAKKRLSVGEERAAFQMVIGEINQQTGWRKPNIEMVGIAEMAAYIVDWSFRDVQDRPVKVSLDAIKQLDSTTFKEIEQALEQHVAAIEAEVAAAKNASGDGSKSGQTSLSVA